MTYYFESRGSFVTRPASLAPVRSSKPRTKKVSLAQQAKKFTVLQPQEIILGLFGEYVEEHEQVWSGGLVNLLQDLGFSVAGARVAINRVCLRNLLISQREGRFIFYASAPRLLAVIEEGRHHTFSAKADPQWDGSWRIVLYQGAEGHKVDGHRADRVRLGRWLTLRHFGVIQEGIWIAGGGESRELKRLISRLGMEGQVLSLNVSLNDPQEARNVIHRAWNLELLSSLYDMFLDKFEPTYETINKKGVSPLDAFVIRTRLIDMFRKMATIDPNLPDTVLEIEWRRGEALELFYAMHPLLAEGAREHFEQCAIRTTQPIDMDTKKARKQTPRQP